MKYFAFLLLLPFFSLAQADMSPQVRNELYNNSRSADQLEVWIQFSKQLDYTDLSLHFESKGMSNHERRNYVYRLLHENSQYSKNWLESFLSVYEPQANIKKVYWGNNTAVVSLQASTLKKMVTQAELKWVEMANERHVVMEEFKSSEDPQLSQSEAVNGREIGLEVINAPAMWARGYSGLGRLACIMDTGFWDEHPALDGRWKGRRAPLKETWLGYDSPKPHDKGRSHGTHVTGTVLGLDRANNDTIGVAFNAQFIADDHVVSNTAEIKPLHVITPAFEWAFDPDGDTSTYHDVPDVINNSWGHEFDTSEYVCINPIGDAIAACQLGGSAVVWSAGNNGPGGRTIGSPATITRNPYFIFTVGAVSPHTPSLPIANFSSRGPSHCADSGNLAIKPEVVAPGVGIRSAVGQDGYDNYQGTSMSGPHVAGAVLLLKEAFPNLPGEKLLEALYMTAHDLGAPGEDNVYGNGVIDVDSAFQWLSLTHTPTPPADYSEDLVLNFEGFKTEGTTCNTNNEGSIVLINAGSKNVMRSEFKVIVESFGGGSQTLTPTSDLMIGDTMRWDVPVRFNPVGRSGFKASLDLNSGYKDAEWNNVVYGRWDNLPSASIPFEEKFAADYGLWTIENPDLDYGWNLRVLGDSGKEELSIQLTWFAMPGRKAEKDYLISPKFDAREFGRLRLEYDWAYTTKVKDFFVDTLNIYATSNCDLGKWKKIYSGYGDALMTRDVFTQYFWAEPQDWKTNSIDLSEFDGQDGVVIKFEGINNYGNNLYLDNIKVLGDNVTSNEELISEKKLKVFPNPSNGLVTLEGELSGINGFVVKSIDGKEISRGELEGSSLDLSSLTKGVYLLQIEGTNSETHRLVIE